MDLNWYETLNKPLFTPPSWVFAPAWTVLYILMFLSLYIYLRTYTKINKTNGTILFLTQLLFNFLWSPSFFYWQNIKLSFFIIILLVLFLIGTIVYFYKVSKISAILLIPYFLWVCFAIYLNFGFMVLNP
ncbi:tryptophan-rich sensory protein [bacterium]|nr:tryptophan-rich sensory protein [bacterium]